MHFIDTVEVVVKAGNGGNGRVSFRHEKSVSRGGPDGGDAGHGGSVIFEASRNQSTLARFRFEKELSAKPGDDGRPSRQHGRSGADLIVPVPVGTVAYNEAGVILADLTEDGQRVVLAKGGHGGFGNAHFVSSVRQAPKFAEKGEPGDELTLRLELKMIADVGLVGLPNAGKSTLLSRISNARPEIADYPFTTLVPNLGVVDVGGTSLLFADIPGLIEGASEGKGLGHEFLRHIERTAVLLHMIDAYQDDPVAAYQTVTQELRAHDAKLLDRPQIVAINKVEGLDEEIIGDILQRLRQVVPEGTALFAMSTQAGTGLKEMLYAAKAAVEVARQKAAEQAEVDDLPVHTLHDDADAWHIEKLEDAFLVTGPAIDRFALRTDYSNDEAVQRLRDIMQRTGIMHELTRKHIKAGQTIRFVANAEIVY